MHKNEVYLLNISSCYCHICELKLVLRYFQFKMVCQAINPHLKKSAVDSYDLTNKSIDAKKFSSGYYYSCSKYIKLSAYLDQYSLIPSIFLVALFLSSRGRQVSV